MAAKRTQITGLSSALLLGAGVACVLCWVAAGSGLARADDQAPEFTIAVDVSQVVLDVTVRDRRGRLIPGLIADRFRVYEDGVEQEILDVSQADRPLTLGLVVDSSRSIGERRREIIQGAMRLAALSHDNDDLFLVSFNDRPRFGLGRDTAYTRDLPTLRTALFRMRPEGMTSLYDAVLSALDHLSRGKWEREAAVVFSDGGDTASQATLEETLERVRRSDALVYTIGLASEINPYRSSKTLKQIARASGGEAYFPRREYELERACEEIATEMRSQYTVTYSPSGASHEGLYRKIEVNVVGEGSDKWRVRAREGYYEPGERRGADR